MRPRRELRSRRASPWTWLSSAPRGSFSSATRLWTSESLRRASCRRASWVRWRSSRLWAGAGRAPRRRIRGRRPAARERFQAALIPRPRREAERTRRPASAPRPPRYLADGAGQIPPRNRDPALGPGPEDAGVPVGLAEVVADPQAQVDRLDRRLAALAVVAHLDMDLGGAPVELLHGVQDADRHLHPLGHSRLGSLLAGQEPVEVGEPLLQGARQAGPEGVQPGLYQLQAPGQRLLPALQPGLLLQQLEPLLLRGGGGLLELPDPPGELVPLLGGQPDQVLQGLPLDPPAGLRPGDRLLGRDVVPDHVADVVHLGGPGGGPQERGAEAVPCHTLWCGRPGAERRPPGTPGREPRRNL